MVRINHRCTRISQLDALIDDIVHLVSLFGNAPSYLLEGNAIALVMVCQNATNLIDDSRWEVSFLMWLVKETHNDILTFAGSMQW